MTEYQPFGGQRPDGHHPITHGVTAMDIQVIDPATGKMFKPFLATLMHTASGAVIFTRLLHKPPGRG